MEEIFRVVQLRCAGQHNWAVLLLSQLQLPGKGQVVSGGGCHSIYFIQERPSVKLRSAACSFMPNMLWGLRKPAFCSICTFPGWHSQQDRWQSWSWQPAPQSALEGIFWFQVSWPNSVNAHSLCQGRHEISFHKYGRKVAILCETC